MTTLAEIRTNPATYLGEAETEDYGLFFRAVEALTAEGMAEDEAVYLVWNDGDWVTVTAAIVFDHWLPTHVITTPIRRQYVMHAYNGAFYTAAEWVYVKNADYELADDGTLLFRGQPAPDSTITEL